jgi:hypothetical protein
LLTNTFETQRNKRTQRVPYGLLGQEYSRRLERFQNREIQKNIEDEEPAASVCNMVLIGIPRYASGMKKTAPLGLRTS